MYNTVKAGSAFEDWRQETVPGFDYVEIDGSGIFKIKSFEDSGLVRHGFTSRKGGVSKGCYASLNMSWTRTDSEDNTLRNYEIAARSMGIDPADLVVVNGDHGTTILSVGSSHKGCGIYRPWDIGYKFDGMATSQNNIALCTIHGDCTPIFILDPYNKAICMVHSGWRGTIDGIPRRAIEFMAERYGTDSKQLLIAIGPAIGKCCFNVGLDVADSFKNKYPNLNCVAPGDSKGTFKVDLLMVALWQLFGCGIQAQNLTVADMCTCCDSERFHSYRRDGMQGGSMAGMLQLI